MSPVDLSGLPGEELIRRGLEDVARGEDTAEATLLRLASRRLAELGFAVPSIDDGEVHLYGQLAERFPRRDPFPVYGAWLEILDSFLAASAARRGRSLLGA